MNRNLVLKKQSRRIRRKMRIRKKVVGSTIKPRITVFKSNKYTYFQVIDDENGHTLASGSTLKNKTLNSAVYDAYQVLLSKGIVRAVFDRNGYKFHGKVKQIAEHFRNLGLQV